ncbi:MAG: hypothetical protein WCB63_00865 [Polyangiales bacterium]
MAFAVVLSPAFMQIDGGGCQGDTTLAALEFKPFRMPGMELPQDVIQFEPDVQLYEVTLPVYVTQAMLVLEASDPAADLAVQCYSDDGFVEGHQIDEVLGWTVIDLPEGNSRVKVFVRPSGGGEGCYIIRITREPVP